MNLTQSDGLWTGDEGNLSQTWRQTAVNAEN